MAAHAFFADPITIILFLIALGVLLSGITVRVIRWSDEVNCCMTENIKPNERSFSKLRDTSDDTSLSSTISSTLARCTSCGLYAVVCESSTAPPKLDQIQGTGADVLATTCPFCERNFKDSCQERDPIPRVMDLIELVDQAREQNHGIR